MERGLLSVGGEDLSSLGGWSSQPAFTTVTAHEIVFRHPGRLNSVIAGGFVLDFGACLQMFCWQRHILHLG